jgi:peptidoglycan/LPS O-acetylase OafA/YrhL
LGISFREIPAVLLFYRNYVDGSWYTGHFWSLSIEEHFYLFIPCLAAIFSKRRALFVFLFAAIAYFVIRFIEDATVVGKVEFRTEARFDALMYGSAIAILLTERSIRLWFVKTLTPLRIGAILLAAIVILQIFHQMPLRRTVVAITLPILISYTVLNPELWVSRLLDAPLLAWIGRLSYSLHIWQMLFLVPFDRPLSIAQTFPVNLICAFLCAVISYYFIERPSIRIGHLTCSPKTPPILS